MVDIAESKARITQEEIEKIPQDVRCGIALSVAMEVLAAQCADKDTLAKHVAEILGIDIKDINPVSQHCRQVLDRGVTKEVCGDFREIRRFVMCKAFEILDTGPTKSLGDALRAAWKVAKDLCVEQGVVV